MAEGRKTKFTPARKHKFLEAFRRLGLLHTSAAVVDVVPETIRRHRKDDSTFAADYDEALQDFRETLESEAYRRAVHGLKEEIYYQGGVVGTKLNYSDRMLELLLKRHIPEFRDKHQVDMNISGGVLVVPGNEETAEEWEARLKEEQTSGGKAKR